VYAPSAGFIYAVEKGLNLRLGAGYFYVEVDNDEDEQGIFGNSQIDKTWTSRRGSLSLAALTGLDQNNFGAENVGLERYAAIQGSAMYKFARTLSGDLNGSYRNSDVVGTADQDANDDTGEKVHRFRAGAGLTYNPLKWMAIRLAYNFNKVNSENNEDEYDEHRGILNITLTPDKPYRHID
jgi:opacity protein-like surface antigen